MNFKRVECINSWSGNGKGIAVFPHGSSAAHVILDNGSYLWLEANDLRVLGDVDVREKSEKEPEHLTLYKFLGGQPESVTVNFK